MLFNSTDFLFKFLPATLFGFFLLNGLGWKRWSIAWLVLASCVFYGYFSVGYLGMLIVLILFNYAVGVALSRGFHAGRKLSWLLAFGIVVDLGVLAYFKYTTFLLDNANFVLGTDFVFAKVILPIGISFFTFQKIAYLVDAYRGEAEEYNLLDFSLFVMYFPQLIAGPIVHHKEIIPQFRALPAKVFKVEDFAAGQVLFLLGYAKKTIVADTISGWSDASFARALSDVPSLYEAWTGMIAFSLQIYFDFSGYTDMALGLALMIGIRLPLNFNSPYKSTSIIDFWRTWHMTLSRFLRDYLYIPLGGNRRGPLRRYVNLMLTMLIGGLWHGAAWTFVIWGGLHGLYLVVNHAWRRLSGRIARPWIEGRAAIVLSWLITFLAVSVAWLFFRAETFGAALNMLHGLMGAGGTSIPLEDSSMALFIDGVFGSGALDDREHIAYLTAWWHAVFLALLVLAVALLPNSQQLLADRHPALEMPPPAGLPDPRRSFGKWLIAHGGTIALGARTGILFAMLFALGLVLQGVRTSHLQPFIYFQF